MTHVEVEGSIIFYSKEEAPIGSYTDGALTVENPRLKGPISAYCKRNKLGDYAENEEKEAIEGDFPAINESEQAPSPEESQDFTVYSYILNQDTKMFVKGQRVYVRWSEQCPKTTLRKDRLVGYRKGRKYEFMCNELIMLGTRRRFPPPELEVMVVDEEIYNMVKPVTLPPV